MPPKKLGGGGGEGGPKEWAVQDLKYSSRVAADSAKSSVTVHYICTVNGTVYTLFL